MIQQIPADASLDEAVRLLLGGVMSTQSVRRLYDRMNAKKRGGGNPPAALARLERLRGLAGVAKTFLASPHLIDDPLKDTILRGLRLIASGDVDTDSLLDGRAIVRADKWLSEHQAALAAYHLLERIYERQTTGTEVFYRLGWCADRTG